MARIRRLYIYLVAAASLGMVVVGPSSLGGILLDLAFGRTALSSGLREGVAWFGALTVVGTPIWALHWSAAQRLTRSLEERASGLRRLFLYAVLAALLIATASAGVELLADALAAALGAAAGRPAPWEAADGLAALWRLLLAGVFWGYYFRIAARDREAVGELGASATLRRWYAYGAQGIALILWLFAAQDLLYATLLNFLPSSLVLGTGASVAEGVARAVVGLAIWVFHAHWTSHGASNTLASQFWRRRQDGPAEWQRLLAAEDDRHSTLREVQRFLALALSIGLTLQAASQPLYYALARILGVETASGVPDDLVVALAQPLSTLVVFGMAWLLLQRQLRRDAAAAEASRQAGVRRLYTHLVAISSLVVAAAGVGGVLWTLSDQAFAWALPTRPDDWRDQASFFLTLVAVGLPTWLIHWRPAPPALERAALTRRLYVFAVLLAAVLVILSSGSFLIFRVLNALLAIGVEGAQPVLGDVGRALSVSLVAAGVGAYHWRVLREDNAQRALEAAESDVSAPPAERLLVEIVGATPADIRSALVALPAGSTYSIGVVQGAEADPPQQ